MHRLFLLLFAAGALLLWLGLATAVQDPVVTRYRVPIAGLTRPMRIVQLSDIHFSHIDMPAQRLDRIVDQANALAPDLVLLTGDYAGAKIIDWPHIRLEDALFPLARLRAPLGVFAVPGNHDQPYWTRWVFARTPVRLLAGQGVDLGAFTLVGADDWVLGPGAAEGLAAAVAGARRDRPVVVVAHEPEFLTVLPPGVALFVAGHTHGGQVAPFGLTIFDGFYRQYRRGLFRIGGLTMVVSSGLGTTGVPLRLGVPPEIVEITLVPAHSVGRNSGTDR